jgi:hypothetical protein
MLLDVRAYRRRPGTISTHLEVYEQFGKGPQFRCLGTQLCYLRTETGDPIEYDTSISGSTRTPATARRSG